MSIKMPISVGEYTSNRHFIQISLSTSLFFVLVKSTKLEVIHIKQPRRKTYSLQINTEGQLIVKTDVSFPKYKLAELVEKHRTWIDKHISEYEKFKAMAPPLVRDLYSILGKDYKVIYKPAKNRIIKINATENTLEIIGVKSYIEDQDKVHEALEKFLREFAKEYFINRSYHYAKLYGFDFNRITVKDQKTKWGSCSASRNLNYNWKLIFAPKDILDYVVAHEVCHLKEMNHSKKFWDLVLIECPDYKKKRKWLQDNGNLIQRYFD